MTYQKIGTEFWDELAAAGLSDAAVRTHAEALGWICRVEALDCRVPKRVLRRFAGSDDWELAVKELIAAGFWREDGDSYLVVHHSDVIRNGIIAQHAKRTRDRRAQTAYRARKTQR